MKTQILQGINLESNSTIIKIKLNKKLNNALLEEIKNYHPIFLKEYKVTKNILIITSKLPHLWIEIGKILGKKNERELALNIIKKQVKSMSTIAILEVADKTNEEITQFLVPEGILDDFGEAKFNRQYCIGCGKRSGITLSFSTSSDSQMAKQIQSDKQLTNRLTDRLMIPSAPWEKVVSLQHLKKIFPKYKKPVVIKPTSFAGGRGVYMNIKTLKEAISAFEKILKITNDHPFQGQQNKIMIQEQISGEDYRILTINGKMRAVTKRVPAFVIGDGVKTIKQLIEKTNKDPRRDTQNPTHTLKPIIIDDPLIHYLQEQNLNLKYIPQKNEKIFVRKVASMSQGGITIDYTDKVHQQIKQISETLAHSLRAYVLGIDVICKDIKKPLTKTNGGIIEVNTMPEAYLNMYPVQGPQRPQIAKDFLKGLLRHQKTKKIVIIDNKFEKIKNIYKSLKGNTGIYSLKSVYINNNVINKDVDTQKAIQALKINSYLDNIILHYQNIQEVEKYGMGFDKIDILYIQKKYKDKIKHIDQNLIEKILFT